MERCWGWSWWYRWPSLDYFWWWWRWFSWSVSLKISKPVDSIIIREMVSGINHLELWRKLGSWLDHPVSPVHHDPLHTHTPLVRRAALLQSPYWGLKGCILETNIFSKQSIWYRGYHLVCYIFIALCFWDVSLTGPPISVDGHTESHAIMCAVWPPVYHWSLSTGAAQVHLVSGYSRYSAYPHIHTHWFWHPAFISHLSFNPYIMTHNSQQRTWCLPSCVDFFCRFHLNTLYSRVSKKIVRNVAEFLFRGFWAVKIWVFWGAENIYAITSCLADVHNVSTLVWTPISPLHTPEWPFDQRFCYFRRDDFLGGGTPCTQVDI